MASLGSHGLTPLAVGQDGLGITDELHGLDLPGSSLPATRDTEEERSRRLGEVVVALEIRIAGRGVCREGVERITKVAGLNFLWQNDKINIAGNCVDLEVEFEATPPDVVKDVILKYASPDAEEGEKREEASAILKQDLIPDRMDEGKGPWKSMEDFKDNLKRLGKLDQLSQGVNCFEAIEGLYESFRKIWDEEKKRLKGLGPWDQLCRSSIGRPVMHKRRKVGLGLEYWVEKKQLLTVKRPASEQDMDLDPMDSNIEAGNGTETASVSTMTIECEAAMPQYPPIRISKDWVGSPTYTSTEDAGNDQQSLEGEPRQRGINWLDPQPTFISPSAQNDSGATMDVDNAEGNLPKPPNVQFCFSLEPPVILPYLLVNTVYNNFGLQSPYAPNQAMTYEAILAAVSGDSTKAGISAKSHDNLQKSRKVWTRRGNSQTLKNHDYSFHPPPEDFFCLLHGVAFSHPQQLVALLPVSRIHYIISLVEWKLT